MASAAINRRLAGGDDGFTLSEMLVYSMLLLIVILIAGLVLVQTLVTQRDVRALNVASNDGQIAVRQIERSLRNAVQGEIYMPSSHGGNLLVVKTRVGEDGSVGANWLCRAWHYDSTSEQLRTITSAATGTPATRGLTAPLDSSSWNLVMENVVPTLNAGVARQVFENEALGGAKVHFDITVGSTNNRITMATTVIPRDQGDSIGGVSCT